MLVNSSGISAVIPLFNKERHIQKCIRSVLEQDFSPMELIVIDDGSTDRSAELVSDFNDSRIRLIQQENKGVSAARNAGVAVSSYDSVAFLDADDEWLPGHLKTLAALAAEYADAGFWATGFHQKSKNEIRTHSSSAPTSVVFIKSYVSSLLEGGRLVHTSASMVRKSNFFRAGGFMEEFSQGEDDALWLLLVLDNGVAVSPSVSAIYNSGVSGGLAQRLIAQPDACTVAIDQLLAARSDIDQSVQELLVELQCQKALAHAISATLHGNRQVARAFMQRARHTKKFAMRRKQLQILLLLNGNLLALTAKLIISLKRRLLRIRDDS